MQKIAFCTNYLNQGINFPSSFVRETMINRINDYDKKQKNCNINNLKKLLKTMNFKVKGFNNICNNNEGDFFKYLEPIDINENRIKEYIEAK
jgi:hypothetical protein